MAVPRRSYTRLNCANLRTVERDTEFETAYSTVADYYLAIIQNLNPNLVDVRITPSSIRIDADYLYALKGRSVLGVDVSTVAKLDTYSVTGKFERRPVWRRMNNAAGKTRAKNSRATRPWPNRTCK